MTLHTQAKIDFPQTKASSNSPDYITLLQNAFVELR